MLDDRYVAGLFDGEGCIHLRIQTYRDKRWPDNRAVQRRVLLEVGINMTDPRAIRSVLEAHGGFLKTPRRPSRPTHRPLHYWKVCNEKAAVFLSRILPYLLIKKEEAILAIEYQTHMRSRRGQNSRGPAVTPKEWAYRESVIAELKRLKHVIYP